MAERDYNAAEFDFLDNDSMQELLHPPYIGDDGLLYCSKCNTPKQSRYTTESGRECLVVIDCECRQREKRARLRRELQRGIEDERAKLATFAQDDGADSESGGMLRRYAEKWDEMQAKNIGLLLHGCVGGGKTFFAACIANAIIDRQVEKGDWNAAPVIMTTIPALRDEMQRDYGSKKAEVLRRIVETPLLILDDVGYERKTSTSEELAYEIVNKRYKANKPLIVTTNLTPGEIRSAQEQNQARIFDRIVEMCSPVHIKAEGRRQAIGLAKSAEARRILGI